MPLSAEERNLIKSIRRAKISPELVLEHVTRKGQAEPEPEPVPKPKPEPINHGGKHPYSLALRIFTEELLAWCEDYADRHRDDAGFRSTIQRHYYDHGSQIQLMIEPHPDHPKRGRSGDLWASILVFLGEQTVDLDELIEENHISC